MSGNTLLEKSSYSDRTDQYLHYILLLLFTLVVRLFFLQMINVGPDEIDYWFSAKRLIGEGRYPTLMHRTIRWPIILPVALTQIIFGTHPNVYYITPILNSLIQSILMFKIGRTLFNRDISFYATLFFTIWPYMWRTGSQIRPAIYSLTFVLFSIYFLLKYCEESKVAYRHFLLSVIFLFIAYMTKITNVYFVPSFMIIIYLRTKRMKPSLSFGAILSALYLVEHFCYYIFTGQVWGRLGIIAQYHLASNYAENLPHSFIGLFERYTILDFPWKIFFILFIIATIYQLKKNIKWVKELSIMHGVFFFLLTFMVTSLHPVKPVESFLDRYFITCFPTMCLVTVSFLYLLVPDRIKTFISAQKSELIGVPLLLLIIISATLLPLPASVERYFTPLGKIQNHPILLLDKYVTMTDNFDLSKSIVMSIGSEKPLDTFNRTILDDPSKARYTEEMKHQLWEGKDIYFISNSINDLTQLNPDQRVLLCERFNFSMKYVTFSEIPNIKDKKP